MKIELQPPLVTASIIVDDPSEVLSLKHKGADLLISYHGNTVDGIRYCKEMYLGFLPSWVLPKYTPLGKADDSLEYDEILSFVAYLSRLVCTEMSKDTKYVCEIIHRHGLSQSIISVSDIEPIEIHTWTHFKKLNLLAMVH